MNVAFLGLHGIPYSREASDIRIISFAQLLIKKGNGAIIFNKYPVSRKNERDIEIPVPENSTIKEVLKINPSDKKLFSPVVFLLLYPLEFIKVIQNHRKSKIDILHVYTGHFFDLFFYFILAKVIKAKVVYQYVEYRSAIKRSGIYHQINGHLIDKYGYNFFDGVITISHYLNNHIHSIDKNIPSIIIPPICDFDLFDTFGAENYENNYLLFCGSAGYFDIIRFVVDSYNTSKCNSHKVKLILVISGSQNQIEKVQQYALSNTNIKLVNNLPYAELIEYYKGAEALLIPIRDTVQDVARFPNKICEYTASKGVIITVNNGEIPYYFKNEINAVIAEEYSVKSFAEKIDWVLDNQNRLENLKENAYMLGKEYFDIHAYSDTLDSFLHDVVAR
jgi:glycosyltransferase involved in cell wall biosynthesis